MRNTQRVDSLLVITSDIARLNQIVAQSHDWELKELDDFLEEYVEGDKLKKTNPKPVFVSTKENFSLFTVETKKIHGKSAYLLTLVSGFSPMNWDPEFFAAAERQVDLSGKPVYMRLYKDPEDGIDYPVR